MKIVILSIVLTSLSLEGLSAQNSKQWPRILPLSTVLQIPETSAIDVDTPVLAYIRDTGGTPIYKLECHSGDYSGQSELDFSGDFQCVLFAVNGATLANSNLLAADTKDERSADWWNRGRMRSAQLRGECLKYSEYSTVRHFKLRGMLLTLGFTNIQWRGAKSRQNDRSLKSFTFTLNVVPDAAAQSSRAERLSGPKPPTACYP